MHVGDSNLPGKWRVRNIGRKWVALSLCHDLDIGAVTAYDRLPSAGPLILKLDNVAGQGRAASISRDIPIDDDIVSNRSNGWLGNCRGCSSGTNDADLHGD